MTRMKSQQQEAIVALLNQSSEQLIKTKAPKLPRNLEGLYYLRRPTDEKFVTMMFNAAQPLSLQFDLIPANEAAFQEFLLRVKKQELEEGSPLLFGAWDEEEISVMNEDEEETKTIRHKQSSQTERLKQILETQRESLAKSRKYFV